MYYVYLLQSISHPERRYYYIGFTANLKVRFRSHNEAVSAHTSRYKPWRLVANFASADERRAREFEYCLKTGSGNAFAKKRFW